MKKSNFGYRHALGGVAALGLLVTSVSAGPEILGGKAKSMEAVPKDATVRTFWNDAAGSVAADVLTGAGALVYETYNSHGSTFAQFHNFQPFDSWLASPMQLSAEYAGSGEIVGYSVQVYRSSADPGGLPGDDLASVNIELWDGDPLGVLDTAVNGYLNAPIPGTQCEWSNFLPVATVANLKCSLPAPVAVTNADNRVWMVLRSNACRLGWIHSFVIPTVGISPAGTDYDSWERQLDRENVGTCCADGSACDVAGGTPCLQGVGDPTGSRGWCTDGIAETPGWVGFGAPCTADPNTSSCSNFVASIFGQGNFAMAIVPISNVPFGSLDAGAVLNAAGNELKMLSGDTDVILDVVATDWGNAQTIKAYQANLDASGYVNGLGGTIQLADIACATQADCINALGGACSFTKAACRVDADCPGPAGFDLCNKGPKCNAPGPYNPITGCEDAYINTGRGDFLFANTSPLPAMDRSTINYRWACALSPGAPEVGNDTFNATLGGFPDPGAYMGSLHLHVPADAKGTYEIGLFPNSSLVQNDSTPVPLLGVQPGRLTVLTGQCCTGFDCLSDTVTKAQCDSLGGIFNASKTCLDSCSCVDNAGCFDGDACTVDVCESDGQCSHTAVAVGANECCDPNSGDDVAGTGAICNRVDGQVCTDDLCSLGGNSGTCQNPPNTSACNDGNPCSYGDACNGVDSDDAVACAGTDIEDPPIGCTTIDDCPEGSTGCSPLTQTCECKLDVPLICGVLDGDACVDAGDKVVYDINRGPGQTVCGAQFSVSYDPTCLSFNSINPGGGSYTHELEEIVDTGSGTIFYAVGVDPFGGIAACSGAAETLASISFTKIGDCDSCALDCTSGANPFDTVMVDVNGWAVAVTPEPGDTVYDTPSISLDVPDDIKQNVDCDANTAIVDWDMPTCSSDCGNCTVRCSGSHESGEAAAGNGGEHPIGTTTYTCTASADGPCGGTVTDSWTVTINDQTALDVVVQLSPIMANNVDRCITFELYADCVQAPLVFTADMHFGGLRDLVGHFTDSIKIPSAGQWICITAKDQLHTLRATDFLTCDGGVYSAVFKGDPFFGGNWLIGGNLDGWKKDNPNASHDVIDILDFGQFVAQYGWMGNGDTPCGTEGPHADVNGDGVVDGLDFAFVSMNFLSSSKAACCGEAAARTPARTEISVRELRQMGMADLAVADLNGDGLVNTDDMAAFMAGEEPNKGQIRRHQGGSLRGK